MWVDTNDIHTVSSMLASFNTTYIASGAITAVKSRGVTTLLLAPSSYTAPASISAYAERVAELILQIKNTYNVTIDVTGLTNEPEPGWTAIQIVEGVNDLRASLDSRGLTNVKIIVPETSVHPAAPASVKAIYDNGAAWDNIYAIADHSYAFMQNNDMEVLKQGKPWWITEASSNDANEQAEDENQACTILSRFLCELNHGVDEWIFFIGLGEQYDVSTYNIGTAFLMPYDRKTASIVPFLKYYYFNRGSIPLASTILIFRDLHKRGEVS